MDEIIITVIVTAVPVNTTTLATKTATIANQTTIQETPAPLIVPVGRQT